MSMRRHKQMRVRQQNRRRLITDYYCGVFIDAAWWWMETRPASPRRAALSQGGGA